MMKVNIYKKIKNFSLFTYLFLIVIRIVLVFLPQYGYIHPDEFFQTSEVISGTIFKLKENSDKIHSLIVFSVFIE